MRHTLGVLVENQPGVLSRVAGLFSGRGFNIECLTVAETLDPEVSRLTLVTTGDEMIMEQIVKQLNKLVSVIKVIDFREVKFVDREMALVKVKAEAATRAEVLGIVEHQLFCLLFHLHPRNQLLMHSLQLLKHHFVLK